MGDSEKTVKITADISDFKEWVRAIKSEVAEPTSTKPRFFSILQKLNQFVQEHKLWLTVLLFILAWLIYDANPMYPVKIWASASAELEEKREKQIYEADLSRFYIQMGNNFLTLAKFADAKKAFEEAGKLNRNSKPAEFGLLKSKLLDFSALNEFDSQIIISRIELLKKSKLDPGNFDAHIGYAEALLMSQDQSKVNDAINLLNRVLTVEQNHTAARGLLASIYIRQNKFDEAILHLNQAIETAGQDTHHRMNLSYAYEKKGEFKKAYQYLLQVQKIDPEAFLPLLEITRFNLLYFHQFEVSAQNCDDMVMQFEQYKLQQRAKNQSTPVRYIIDEKPWSISTWAAKKAYCNQLSSLARYFLEVSQNNNTANSKLNSQLQRIWAGDFESKNNLPIFLMHDLNLLVSADRQTFTPILNQLGLLYETAQRNSPLVSVKRFF